MPELIPLPGRPVLSVHPDRRRDERWIALADLHLGLGATTMRSDGPPGVSAAHLSCELIQAARDAGANRVFVVGDVKDTIIGVPRALRSVIFDFFGSLLAEGLDLGIVLGNHDVGLVPQLPREVRVFPATGRLQDGVGLFHGHRAPSERVRRARVHVVGHLHPGFRFAPTSDERAAKQRCWVRVVYPPRRRGAPRRELVVLPAFHPLAGTEALNHERPARYRSFLYRRFIATGVARAYLLDGTDLGPLPTPPPGPRTVARPRARRRR